MKKILSLLLGLLLLPMFMLAQYDPANPPHPDYPDDAKPKYPVICEAIPSGSYTFQEHSYIAGANVSVYAGSHNEVIFLGWYDINGNELTKDNTYNFVMPAAPVKLYAKFRYAPNNPAHPEVVNKYKLSLKMEPKVAGSFNFTDQKVAEGSMTSLYAYKNNGFKFQKWVDQDGCVVGTGQQLEFMMPSKNTTLTAYMVYDPEVPQQPGTNNWDALTGELSMDYFTPGYLYSAMEKMADRSEVTHLMVEGEMTGNDFQFTSYYSNLTYVDLSRTAGYTELPAYTWRNNSNLQEIELPASLKTIKYEALRNCSMLRIINCYAMVPPVIESGALSELSADLIVYVPESSVSLYQAKDGWKDYDIQPMRSQVGTIKVDLLTASGKDYTNKTLELLNTHSGQRFRYILTDRVSYSFPNLPKKSYWKAFYKNPYGDVISESEEIYLDSDSKTINVDATKKLATLRLKAVDEEGNDLDCLKEVHWFDASGNMHVSPTLTDQIDGKTISYLPILKDGVTCYEVPTKTSYKVDGQGQAEVEIAYCMTPLPSYIFIGKVIDAHTGFVIKDAHVTAKTTFGTSTITQTVTTGNLGNFSLSMTTSGDIEIEISGAEHVSKKLTLANAELSALVDGKLDMGAVSLSPVKGIVARVALFKTTYQKGRDGWESIEKESSWDESTAFTFLNNSTKQALCDYFIQDGKVIFTSGISAGDEILATISSAATPKVYDDTTVKAMVNSEGEAELDFHVVTRGCLYTRFLVTDNTAVWGILFDSSGNMVRKELYNTKWNTEVSAIYGENTESSDNANHILFPLLEDGLYTLVTIGHSDFMPAPNTLSAFAAIGFEKDRDYLAVPVTVKDGQATEVRNVVVPLFDETRFYYTGVNTSFAINRSNAVAGTYLTLNGKVDFQDNFKERVSDVRLYFELPYNCKMVEGSAMLDRQICAYELNRTDYNTSREAYNVTIPLGENFTDRARLCIVPSQHGNYSVSAYVKFKLDGVEKMQPIGTASYTINDLTIWSPAIIATPTLFVEGTAPGMSQVTVVDLRTNESLGTTKALADGYWTLETTVPNIHNLDMVEIQASIVSPDGTRLMSPIRPVEFNSKYIQAKTVEMKYWNGMINVNRTIDVIWDLDRYKTSAKSYMFLPDTEFSFVIDLTNNDPVNIDELTLRVFTNNHEWINLPAYYIPELDRWAAHGRFTEKSMPIGVRVATSSDLSESVSEEVISGLDYGDDKIGMAEVKRKVNNVAINGELIASLTIESDGAKPGVVVDDDGPHIKYYMSDYDAETVDKVYFTIVDELNGQSLSVYPVEGDEKAWEGTVRRARLSGKLNDLLTRRIDELEKALHTLNANYDIHRASLSVALGQAIADDAANSTEETKKRIAEVEEMLEIVNGNFALLRQLASAVDYGHYALEDLMAWQAFVDGILPCDGLDDPQARGLWDESMEYIEKFGKAYLAALNAYNIQAAMLDLQEDATDKLYSKIKTLDANKALATLMSTHVHNLFFSTKMSSRNWLRRNKLERNRLINCSYAKLEDREDAWDFSLPYPVIEPIIDPSGYVYEGVSSNRLEGVTATAFYKYSYDDEYGDPHEEIVVWDAEQYGQENPLLTDENGQYQWNVPEGLWQVKFEKYGYETTYSEWLPVPPPQLDVNIAMVQSANPEVVRACAYKTDGDGTSSVEIEFSKYMKPELMTSENVFLKGINDGVETLLTDLTLTCPDLESDVEGGVRAYAKKLNIATNGIDLGIYDEVYVLVSSLLESYAGVPMSESYQQKLDVERRIESLIVPDEMNVAFGEQTKLVVGALPVDAARGRQVRLAMAAVQMASFADSQDESILLTLDENGMAEVDVKGVLYGATALRVELVNNALNTTTRVNIVDPSLLAKVKEPIASRLSGTQVFRGQTVSLSCESEGSTIYYTTDGTCPCESATRMKYTGPIAIQEAMTLKIMAVGYTGEESDVKEYVYGIRQSEVQINLAKGWNWVSHDMASPLDVKELEGSASRILTQTKEVVNDPVLGFVGDLTSVAGHETMKIESSNEAVKVFDGEQYNPSLNTIDLHRGWNWLGYPLSQTMTISDALAYMEGEEGDCITNLEDGFAIYDGSAWQGPLEILDPGHGYLYKSSSDKSFIYSTTSSVNNVKAFYGSHLRELRAPWTFDKHRYPSLMPIIAQLCHRDKSVADSTYHVAAFCGSECRGVGSYEKGILYLSVYGDAPCQLTFKAVNTESGTSYDLTGTMLFGADVVGSLDAPYPLYINVDCTGIELVTSHARNRGIYNVQGVRLGEASRPGLYIIQDVDAQGAPVTRKRYVK